MMEHVSMHDQAEGTWMCPCGEGAVVDTGFCTMRMSSRAYLSDTWLLAYEVALLSKRSRMRFCPCNEGWGHSFTSYKGAE